MEQYNLGYTLIILI